MKIRKKLGLILGGGYFFIFVILFIASNSILMQGFIEQEDEDIQKQMDLAVHALDLRVLEIEHLTQSLSSNDDSYYFMQSGLQHFINNYLLSSNFVKSEINIIVFSDTNGDLVLSKAFDILKMRNMEVPATVITLAQREELGVVEGITGIVNMEEGALMISSQPIFTSDGSGPSAGTLFCGRYLDIAEVDQLREKTYLDIQLMEIGEGAISDLNSSIERPSHTRITGSKAINGIDGEPVLLLRLTTDRDYYIQGLLMTQYFFVTSILTGAIIAVISMMASNKFILERMIKLSGEVNKINPDTIEQGSVQITGSDEISELSEDIDNMLKALANYRKLLKDRERLATIGETAAMVGHDLRNPLQVILMLGSRLSKNIIKLRNASVDERVLSELGMIEDRMKDQIGYMNKIVSDLQDFSRTIKLSIERSDVKELTVSVLETIQIPDNINTVIELGEGVEDVSLDIDYLRRVLNNLFNNAVQAMPDGGTLTVKASVEDETMIYSVSDTGVGIKEEDKATIFTPLFTTKAKGTGLGLAVCRRVINAHGGEIGFESELGKGTTLTFTVPAPNEIGEYLLQEIDVSHDSPLVA